MNDGDADFSVPLDILGIEYPGSWCGVLAWLKIFRAARKTIRLGTAPDVIIQELRAKHPGEIAHFGTYLQPDLAVIVAAAPKNMDFFDNVENVAAEELAAANYSRAALINRNDVDGAHFSKYLKNPTVDTYGDELPAEYYFENVDFSPEKGYRGAFVMKDGARVKATVHLLGEHLLRSAVAAAAVGHIFHLPLDKIRAGLEKIRPLPGRMNPLRGVEGALIIDDAYDTSPAAARGAIRTLYSMDSPSRIVIFGSMEGLGARSQEEHEAIARLLDPALISHLLTVGEEANRYVAPLARQAGIPTEAFVSAEDVTEHLASLLEPEAILLFEASASLHLERVIGSFLKDPADARNLPRQD
jgi:UDP-N-acetylmuramoyl-tripeptide--D-alanyl-D-alanine ligase